jgi:poly-gamma-glutamate synthesis protein (capsule biosynthesis protein)
MNKNAFILLAVALISFSINFSHSQQISQHHYALNKNIWPWTISSENKVTILLLGDTNLQGRINPGEAWQHLLPTLQAASVRFVNLEGAFASPSNNPDAPDIPHKVNWRHSEPRMAEGLIAADIDAVGVANNVTYPRNVLMQSLQVLDSANIGYAGGGKNLETAHQPYITTKDGIRIGFLQYTAAYWPYNHAAEKNKPGVAGIKVDTYYQPPKQLDKPGQPPIIMTIPDEKAVARMEHDISVLKSNVDIVIASYHWGVSGQPAIVGYEQKLAYAAIEAGADIIMGHGNHLVQAVEVYNNKPIFYGLGNAVFDWYRVTDKRNGLLVRAVVSENKLSHVSFVPLTRDTENDPVLLDPGFGKGNDLYQKVKSLS